MKNIILPSFGLCFFVRCIKLDYQTLLDKTVQKFDKNRNQIFEENEFQFLLTQKPYDNEIDLKQSIIKNNRIFRVFEFF